MATVELRHATKTYPDGTRAVDDLSMTIEDGELTVLLGPSGCGKSTLLRMVAGLEDISAGDLLLDGKRANELSPQQRNVAMVFQNYALYPHMTVRRNLEFPLRMRRLAKREVRRRTEEAARILNLTDLLERKPGELSGGQRQRVAMGRAIVREPALFLMDEPLSNLDAKLRVQLRTEIAALQRRLGTTTLYVTHDQVEAMTLGQRVGVMRGGVLQQVAPPAELYDRPANLFVAGFLGSPPMNIFPAILERDGDTPHLRFGEQRLALPDAAPASLRGRPAWAGLRPEAFDWHGVRSAPASVRVTVRAVETLGHEQVVFFDAPDMGAGYPAGGPAADLMAARLDMAHRASAGEELALAVDTAKLHWFDDQGRALAAADR
ncbi:MAG: sn-glycerol-3-phosphate ABC transporter ATP-binding protein UgpC [Gammaproteobacteria bacterium]